ncbi:type II secretion system F family protein [Candidatus Gracilibacteria bacterium]|nr:type II secretion system F family protein [Candidatus Gracilibacteria bacterium]
MILAQEIPYFIDLLSFTLSSGLSIEQALFFVSHKKPQTIAKIVNKKLQELNYGIGLEQIFKDLKKIIPNQSFCHFVSSISQAQKLGVPLSYTLEIQSKLIRTRRRQHAEELSRTAAVKISLPLVLFIFPALLMLYIGPGILHLMKSRL